MQFLWGAQGTLLALVAGTDGTAKGGQGGRRRTAPCGEGVQSAVLVVFGARGVMAPEKVSRECCLTGVGGGREGPADGQVWALPEAASFITGRGGAPRSLVLKPNPLSLPFRPTERARSVEASAADMESRGLALWRGPGPARGPAAVGFSWRELPRPARTGRGDAVNPRRASLR